MEWQDQAIVIGTRLHGETSVILEAFTQAHGRHLGVVRGGRSRRLRAVLQPGNAVLATWRARIEDHMGSFAVEPLRMRAAIVMESASALHALNHICALLRLLPERDPYPELQHRLEAMLEAIDDRRDLAPMIVAFELLLLAALGFGLDIECCALTGVCEDLAFVSPKTGRAVCRSAGEPYRDRILALPAFLRANAGSCAISPEDLAAGFRLTEHFLRRNVLEPRGLRLPDARGAYLAALERDMPLAQTARSALRATP